jgi:hypothetical protein
MKKKNPRGRDAPRQTESIYIPDIDWGGRHRKDMGDLEPLKRSIAEVGLLQPIVVTDDRRFITDPKCRYRLVAGERRLRAMAEMDYTHVPAYVVGIEDATALLIAERDENTCRKPHAPSEAVSLGRALEALEREAARQRQGATRARKGQKVGGPQGGGNFPPRSEPAAVNGKTRDKVGEAVGMSGRTYQKAAAVVAAAEVDPDGFGDLPAAMDRTGKVHQVYREMRRREKRRQLQAKAAAAPPLSPDAARVLQGDNLEVMSRLGAAGERFELEFFDSQYNNGTDYGQGAKADRLPESTFLEGLRVRFEAASRLLTPTGSLWALIDVIHSADLVLMLRGLGLHQRAFITWYETFGQNCLGTFNRCSRHLLYLVRDPKRFVFHEDAVRRVSARLRLGDARADPWGKLWDDVWGIDPPIPRVNDNDPERIPGFPTQLPLALLRAIVGCASDPGDRVLDPFAGSCTTGAACLELGRRFVGIERSGEYVRLARQRLTAAIHGVVEVVT